MRGWRLLLPLASILVLADMSPAHAQRRMVGTYTGTIVQINDWYGAPPAVTVGMPVTGSFYYGISPVESVGGAEAYDFRFGPRDMRSELSAGEFAWDIETVPWSGAGRVLLDRDPFLHRVNVSTYVINDAYHAFSGAVNQPWCHVVNSIRIFLTDDAPPTTLLRGLYLPTSPDDLDLASATSMQIEVSSNCVLFDYHWSFFVNIDELTLTGPGLVDGYCESSPNSFGTSAQISLRGSFGVADQDLTLLATGCVPHQPGVFFYGSSTDFAPFGAGSLCVGGELFRCPSPVIASSTGEAQLAIDWTVPPVGSGAGMITPGSTWYFQYWYRDPGHGFNLSNGLRLVFFP